jgi:branched-chain amino acid transport system permease protein
MSVVVWAIAGLLSGESTMLSGMLDRPATAGSSASGLLLVAFAAAVISRMDNLPTAVFAAIGIEVVSEGWKASYPNDQKLVLVFLFFVLALSLLVQNRRSSGRSELGASVTWAAVQEQRATPKVLRTLPIVRSARWALYGIFFSLLVVLPFIVSKGLLLTAGATLLGAIVTMSVVVITGWAGQVSLAQWAFAAVGAVVAGALTATVGFSFWIAVPLATIVAGAFAALVGLPALRVKGLLLLPLTYAFAIAVQVSLFEDRYFGWLLPTTPIDRPTLFFIDFRDDVSMYFLCVFCLVLAIVVMGNLRRSRTGRILIALRDNDTSAEAFGVPIVRTKLVAFAVAGAMSGFAGAVFVHQQQGINGLSFTADRSVIAFTAAVFGGISSIAGALLGTSWFAIFGYFDVNQIIQTFVEGGGPLYLLLIAPAGLISIVNMGRDSILRVIAQRRQIVVPSLFADYDPDALERQQIPLREPETHAGLAALPAAARFGLASHLYPSASGGDA